MGQLNNLDWEHVDIAAFLAGIKQNGVISGLAVSESTTPAMTVLVSSGSCDVDDVRYTESSGQNLNISNGDATHPRKDIVVYDTSAGNPAVVAGTPAAAPIPPDIPSGDIYLAMVHVEANETTSIVNADIDEGRVFVQDTHHTTHEIGGSDYVIPDLCRDITPTTPSTGWTVHATNLDNITDGDLSSTSGIISTSGQSGETETFQIDLGALKNVLSVKALHRIQSATNYISTYLESSPDNSVWTTLVSHVNVGAMNNTYQDIGEPLAQIRYIRMRFVASSNIGGKYAEVLSIQAFVT